MMRCQWPKVQMHIPYVLTENLLNLNQAVDQ